MKLKHRTVLFTIFVLCALTLFPGCGAGKLPSVPELPSPESTPAPEPVSFTVKSTDGREMELLYSTETLTLEDCSFLAAVAGNAELLPELKEIQLPDGGDFGRQQLEELRAAFPGVSIMYSVSALGIDVPLETQELDLSGAESEDIPELVRELGKLEHLTHIRLTPDGFLGFSEEQKAQSMEEPVLSGRLSIEDIAEIHRAVPDATVDCRLMLFGKEFSTADSQLEYIDEKNIGDGGLTQLRRVLPAMGSLTYLKLDNCGTTSEAMASLRDDFPGIKVVWRIWFSTYGQCGDGSYDIYNCLTDTEKIWATGTCRDETTSDLKYCTDVRYLDMGHNVMTNIDFIGYMPKLEVCVLSITYIDDLSPFANCPELEFLELFRTYVSDLSPLAACTKLEHLYIYDEHREGLHDISPILSLPNLKRFYCTVAEDAIGQTEEFIRLHPDCETDFTWVFIGYTKWRTVNGEYTERYALLRDQIGYDRGDYSK